MKLSFPKFEVAECLMCGREGILCAPLNYVHPWITKPDEVRPQYFLCEACALTVANEFKFNREIHK